MKTWLFRSLKVISALVATGLLAIFLSVPLARWDTPTTPIAVDRQQHYLLTNITVIDVDSGASEVQHVEVNDGRIANIYSRESTLPSDVRAVDQTGFYLLPGLVDAHVHVFDYHELQANLRYGVTSVRNMMGFPVHLRWKSAIAREELLAPNLISASPTLNAGDGGGPFHKKLEGSGEIEELVTRYQRQGYDLIKFYDGLGAEQYKAMAAAAKKRNMPFSGHAPSALPFADVLAQSPTSIEHVEEMLQVALDYKMDLVAAEQLAEQIAKSGVPIIPTRIAFHNVALGGLQHESFMSDGRLALINPFVRFLGGRMLQEATHPDHRKYLQEKDQFLEQLLGLFQRKQVAMAMGTDTGPALTVPGLAVHRELQLYQQAGLDNLSIVQLATRNAARVLQQPKLDGRITVGNRADLLVLAADPLQDLGTLMTPHAVIKDGQYLDVSDLNKLAEASKQHTSFYLTLGLFLEHLLML